MRKNVILASVVTLNLGVVAFAADYKVPRDRKYDFPIYTNQPSGKQLSGVYAPTASPALAPEETAKKIQAPPGFEVRVFAAEPEVVNPVGMTWDDRGRLWVLELYEYPKGAPKGAKGRDRIKILEDTDGDGRADKVTVFADGYSLATGIALGNGGVYLGAAPNLYFLEDTDGDDKADKSTIVKTGFGLEDRHELLNGFAWGPDGWLYMTHGVFTHSKVKDPNDPDDDGVKMDAALARLHPKTKKFEVFADGTSNPWGVDWDERGEAFVSACVIHHLFHMAPGGQYNRQGGTWPNPYGYVNDLPSKGLPAIVDWRHYRAAHAGINIYQGNQYPAEWRGLAFLGNIHQSALNCDRLTPVGATYKGEKEATLLKPAGEALLKKTGETIPKGEDWKFVGPGNFLVSRDAWFRPVSVQTGPDGALWVMDWYDKYPCYQNAQADPEGVDREHGRIWRVVYVGGEAGKPVPSRPEKQMDLAKLNDEQLVQLLGHPNIWQRRQAQRLLKERSNDALVEKVKDYLGKAPTREAAMSAFWALGAMADLRNVGEITTAGRNAKTGDLLDVYAESGTPEIKIWVARSIGDDANASEKNLATLLKLARDQDVKVRAAVAAALRQLSAGDLTINSASRPLQSSGRLMPHLGELLARPSEAGDTYYPHIVWMAMEPAVAANPEPFFALLAANENAVSAHATRRVMRRISDLSDRSLREKYLNAALKFVGDNASKTELASAALDGLIEAQKSKGAPPTVDLAPIFAKLTANAAVADKARRLATLLGDTSASRTLIAKINDAKAPVQERLKGIQAARETKDSASRTELLKLVTTERNAQLLIEGVRALNAFTGDEIAYEIVDAWKNYPAPAKVAAAEVLVTRSKWARALLAGVERKIVKPEDISATARRALARAEDKTIVDNADRLLGRYRAISSDKLQLIAQKKKMVLSGTPNLKAGHEIAKTTCFVCHKLHGEGADIGPDLTGVGRSTLDALLANIIDPNEVIGAGYETTEVELKDGTTISGRVVEESDTRIKLVAAGPTEHTIAKSDIQVANGKLQVRKTDFSLMPEGLEQIPDDDFRNLIWYILNPPQDNRPWTPALRKELIGDEGEKKSAKAEPESNSFRGPGVLPGDGESVALWNPDWRVACQPFEGAPKKLVEYAGRRNVLMTHPGSKTAPAFLERTLEVPAGRQSSLQFAVASDDRGDWELRVLADGKLLHKRTVDQKGDRWKKVSVDLTPFAGRTVNLRLENAATDWSWEFAYWSDIQLQSTEQRAAK